jgi:membrane protein implicated in regulation of membrane protease activity
MYIVVIAWLYVVLMMSITEQSVVAGIMTFLLYGVLPLSIILYVTGAPQRRRRRQEQEKARHANSLSAMEPDVHPTELPDDK